MQQPDVWTGRWETLSPLSGGSNEERAMEPVSRHAAGERCWGGWHVEAKHSHGRGPGGAWGRELGGDGGASLRLPQESITRPVLARIEADRPIVGQPRQSPSRPTSVPRGHMAMDGPVLAALALAGTGTGAPAKRPQEQERGQRARGGRQWRWAAGEFCSPACPCQTRPPYSPQPAPFPHPAHHVPAAAKPHAPPTQPPRAFPS